MLSLGMPLSPLTPVELTMAVRLVFASDAELPAPAIQLRDRLQEMEQEFKALKATDGFNLREFIISHSVKCEEFFISCIALIYPLDCCSMFEPILTNEGLCFTVANTTQVGPIYQQSKVDFALVLDLPTPQQLKQTIEVGYHVYLSDPSEGAPIIFDADMVGQNVPPGLLSTITVQLIKNQRTALHTPWHGLYDMCPRWRYNASYDSDRYSERVCNEYYYERMARRECRCQPLWSKTFGSSRLRPCEPTDMYQCIIGAMLKDNMSDLVTECRTPCVRYKYKSEASYMGLGGDNTSRVEITYNSRQFMYQEHRTTTLSSLFSQIGGCLGLYLGASIITVMEILTFAASWIWYRLVPSKATAKVQHRKKTSTQTIRNLYH